MKRTSTLLSILVCLSLCVNAQYTENFDGGLASLPSCFKLTTATIETNSPIAGKSLATDALGTSSLTTPYLTMTGNTVVSFNYKLSNSINGNATRTIQIGTTDANGIFTQLAALVFDNKSSLNGNPPPVQNYSTTIASVGTLALTIRTIGSTGDGQCYLIIDDLSVSATPHYGAQICNGLPSIQNDNYVANTYTYTGSSVLANDSDPNGETLSIPTIVTNSPDGNVVLNSDGTFTFTPNAGFIGTRTTFTYRVFDNGFAPASGTATVTINFTAAAALPVKLISFSTSVQNNKALAQWSVAENETGDHFEIEKSVDGKNFNSVGILFNTEKIGTENYSYRDGTELTATAYYRLKIVNKNNSISYSKIAILNLEKASANSTLSLLQNPVESTLSFQYKANAAGSNNVVIYNAMGVRVHSLAMNMQKGINSVSLTLGGKINSGTYFLEISNGVEKNIVKMIKK